MVNTVGARPNHYETLGLEPTATAEEIAQAFAREIGMFRVRPIGGLAAVGVAYETLRDPARRRAYDASIGLGRAPEPDPQPDWAPFMIRASGHLAERRAVDPLHRRARPSAAPPRPEQPVDTRLAAIRATLHELAKRDAYDGSAAPAPEPEPARAAEEEARPTLEPEAVGEREAEPAVDEVEHGPIQWSRPALIAGALVLGVGVIGAWAGVVAGNEAEPKEATPALTLAVPPPKPLTASAAAEPAPAPSFAEARPERRTHAATPVARVRRQAQPQRPLSAKELEELPFVEVSRKTSEAAEAAASPAVADVAPVTAAAAHMSLPNAVIARTIHRIGYACGEVASTTPVEGQAGVFNVTCTSGQSYRAAPVRGRYHFRRLGSR